MQRKHLFKKYFIPSLLFFIGICLGFFVIFYVNNTFKVQKVIVTGGSQIDKKAITNLMKGLSTFTLTQSAGSRLIRMGYPALIIKEIRVVLPSTISIEIGDEKPVAFLTTDFGYLALSKNGIVIMKERSPQQTPFPSISFFQTVHHSEYQTGQDIGYSVIKRALIFVSLLADEGYQTETVAIDSVDMIACKTKGFEVAFSQSRLIDLQSHEVREILRQVRAGAMRIKRLDLRFDKPVVQLPQK